MTLEKKARLLIDQQKNTFEKIPGIVVVHQLPSSSVVYMSPHGLRILDVTMEELLEMGPLYHERFFNAEDAAEYVPKLMELFNRNNNEETVTFFQQVRANKEAPWSWYASGTRIFMQDDEGNPYLTITIALPIDSKHYFNNKIERLLEENELLKKNQSIFASLTKREREIIFHMANERTSTDIASILSISEDTVKTHRKNIKSKLGTKSLYDVIKFAQAFDIV
jgi:DNA-binding CsgD family transcriptional regulator